MLSYIRYAGLYLGAAMPGFLKNRRGTPSIETVGLIALIALAVFPLLRALGSTISNVFSFLTSNLNTYVQ